MLRLESGPNESLSLVADYFFDSPRNIFQDIGLESRKKSALESSLVIVDSLWGFDREKVQQLHETLKQKRLQLTANLSGQ